MILLPSLSGRYSNQLIKALSMNGKIRPNPLAPQSGTTDKPEIFQINRLNLYKPISLLW